MKYKSKPVARAWIRERVEKKIRARGAVAFHGFASLFGTAVFLWNLPMYWENRFLRWDTHFRDAILLYGVLLLSFALHVIYYHFKHGAGFARHEEETAARVSRELRRAGAEEAEERKALIELEQRDKLKHRRLLWQHVSLFLGLSATAILAHWTEVIQYPYDADAFLGLMYLIGAWTIAIIAHALRYYFAYGSTSEKRQAKIDAEVAREMAKLGLRRASSQAESAPARASEAVFLADEVESRQSRSRA